MTETCLDILNVVNLNDTAFASTLLKSVKHGLQQENHCKTIITFLNKQLSNSVTRDHGFELLLALLSDIKTEVVEDNSTAWTNFAVSHHPNAPVSKVRLIFITQLITICYKNQDFHKSIVSNTLSKLIDLCVSIHIKSAEALQSLQCLEVCLKYFPSTCLVHKKKVEDYSFQCLDTPVVTAVLEEAATCYHYLNQVGGAGYAGATHINSYSDVFERLLKILNSLYDEVFENISEFNKYTSQEDSAAKVFKKIPPNLNPQELCRIQARRLRNVTVFLTKLLENTFTAKKSFKPDYLLSTIQRGLAVHVHVDDSDMSKTLFSVMVQDHQLELLQLLKTLICCLKHNFVHFSSIKLLPNLLLRTKNCNCFQLSRDYQADVYEVLTFWILNSGEQIDSTTYDKIIKYIILDITPNKKSLVLNIQNTEHKSSKAKQKGIQDKIIKSSEKNNSDLNPKQIELLETVCLAALSALELLFQRIPLTIKRPTCILLFEAIIKNLLQISVQVYEPPYTSKNCRLLLYRVLTAIFDQNRHTIDIALAINVLYLGVRNGDSETSYICLQGLSALEKICQPTHNSLNFYSSSNIEQDEVSNTATKELVQIAEEVSQPEPGEVSETTTKQLVHIMEFDSAANKTNSTDMQPASLPDYIGNKSKVIPSTDRTGIPSCSRWNEKSKGESAISAVPSTSKSPSPVMISDEDDIEIISEPPNQRSENDSAKKIKVIDNIRIAEAKDTESTPTKRFKPNSKDDDTVTNNEKQNGNEVEDMLSSFVDEVIKY